MHLPRFNPFHNLRLELKLLVVFILVSSIPLILINLLWFNASRNQAVISNANQVAVFALVLSVILINVVVLVSLWIAGRIVRPIKILQRGTQLIGQGQLDQKLDISTGDEIEALAGGFNLMAENLKRSIYQISAERNKVEVIISGITDVVIAVDLERNIATFNKAAENLTGYTLEQVIGKPIQSVISLMEKDGEISPEVYCPIKNDDFEGIIYSKKDLKLKGNDKTASVNIITGKIKEGPKVNLGAIITLHDLSSEKQFEEMKLDFVSMAAHELRTPLTSLKGYLYILVRDYKDTFDEKESTILMRVNIATQRLVGLVENLLNVTRIERGALTVHLEPSDWITNVKQVISDLTDQAKDKKLELVFEEPQDMVPSVFVDKFRINEVLTNLLSNAINYTQPGGHIRIWIEQTETEIVTHVRDTGEGIPAEALPHLFTKFFRVSGKLEQGSKGTGLGLYIAKSIITMHNGRIWAESEGLGKGSTFSFTLPLKGPKTDE
jgi:two-component system, NtrC family, sensor histidine kinase KinB